MQHNRTRFGNGFGDFLESVAKATHIRDNQRARIVARCPAGTDPNKFTAAIVIEMVDTILDAADAGDRLRLEMRTDSEAKQRAVLAGDYMALLGFDLTEPPER